MNITSILKDTKCIYHSHINGNIYDYTHTCCKKKARENSLRVPVISHNLFRFDFFFLVKGLRASVWKTRDIVIGGILYGHSHVTYLTSGDHFFKNKNQKTPRKN